MDGTPHNLITVYGPRRHQCSTCGDAQRIVGLQQDTWPAACNLSVTAFAVTKREPPGKDIM